MNTPPKFRLPIAALTLSAAAFGGLVLKEGYSDKAVVPIPNDRPTIGFGSTFDESGQPVKMGDSITAPKAVVRSLAHIAKDETALKKCVTAPLVFLDTQNNNITRPTGTQTWGPWRVTIKTDLDAESIRLTATHRCHWVYANDTDLINIPLKDYR